MSEVNMQPFSEEAENAILGAIIESPSLLDEVSGYLSLSSDFLFLRSSKNPSATSTPI